MFGQLCVRCLDLLLPLGCAGCEDTVPTAHVWCGGCRGQLLPLEHSDLYVQPPKMPVIAAYAYAGPVKHAIHRLKFSGRSDLASRLARDVADALVCHQLPGSVLLVPVPLTAQRLVERGYNQAALLARGIARQLHLAHLPVALRRVHDGSHQVGANKAERAEHVAGAFVANTRRIDNKEILLVDDVVTTGATALACAQALETAGARVVGVAAVARVP